MKKTFAVLAVVFFGWATAVRADFPAPLFHFFVEPAEPTSADFVNLRVTFRSVGSSVRTFERDGNLIRLDFYDDCLICSGHYIYQFYIPLGRMEPGQYRVEATINAVPSSEVVYEFEVAAGTVDYGRAELSIQPSEPTRAEVVHVKIPYETAPCQGRPSLRPAERVGNKFVLELARPLPGEPCANDERAFGSLLADLGQLTPGRYLVELWADDEADPPLARTLLRSLDFDVASADTVELLGRYRASIAWETRDGQTGTAKPVAGNSTESALFSFFSTDNWEVMVKVLDGCAINGHRWVFLAAATDVEFTLTVEDLDEGAPPYRYTSAAGLAPPLADTAAFACTP